MKPLGKVVICWSSEFSYAIGLLVTDGCLYGNGGHIALVSKDLEMIENFRICLGIENKIGKHTSGIGRPAFKVQFGDVKFYEFLVDIGLSPQKSKTLKEIMIPNDYFFDFLRGHFDGDGSFYSYWDTRWRSSHMFYTLFISASKEHILWIKHMIFQKLNIHGHIVKYGKTPTYELRYAKAESLQLLPKLYYNRSVVCLSRKREKIEKALAVEDKQIRCAGGETG